MSIIQLLLLKVPTVLLGIIIVVVYVLFSIIGLYVIRAFHPPQKLKLHNDVAGFIFATLGVIYAVLIAFLIIVTWQDFDQAQKNTAKEANYIASVYRDTSPMPAALRSELKNELADYVNYIINDEWSLMTKGERSLKVQQAQEKIWRLFSGFQPKNETQKIFFTEAVKKLNDACEMRRARILEASSVLHPVLYFILIVGGLMTIAFTMFFGTENFVPQLIMTSMLAAMIGLALFTIIALDCPYSGDISVKPDVFKTVLSTLMSS
jgi:cytochrome c556